MQQRTKNNLCTDNMHRQIMLLFAQDMRDTLGQDFILQSPLRFEDLVRYRLSPEPLPLHADRWRFKARHQHLSYLKRYVFQRDALTRKDRKSRAIESFLQTQIRIAHPSNLAGLTHRSFLVLQRARKIIRSLIGEYDRAEHESLCRFGKRASVGVPYDESYLDVKARTLTGSPLHLSWFLRHITENCNDLLRRGILECIGYKLGEDVWPTTFLELATVAKSWKIDRTILKNTTVGAYYCAGLEKFMVHRLKEEGNYDLRHRADKHGRWVKDYSINRSHVTTDWTSASDSYTSNLINRLYPRSWYNAMKLGRLDQCVYDRTRVPTQMSSFMTMGIGFTFPAMTIGFLAILRAIRQLTKIPGRISVFGDDMIYPRDMHAYVVAVFSDLGFIINTDKTFVNEYFRESCGSDYYAGLDVRPYQPEGSASVLDGKAALVLLYKTANGWLRRWPRESIPRVMLFLESEMLRFTKRIHQVPPHAPDTSGVHFDEPYTDKESLWYYEPIRHDRNGSLNYACLSETRRLRYVPVQLVYLWDTLRSSKAEPEDYPWTDPEDRTSLIWKYPNNHKRERGKNSRNGKEKPELRAFVTRKGARPSHVAKVITTPQWLDPKLVLD